MRQAVPAQSDRCSVLFVTMPPARLSAAPAREGRTTGFRPPPERHWRSYGTEPLPPASEALNQPLRAFPSWFLRIECECCGKATML
jgi:hypothetical protein